MIRFLKPFSFLPALLLMGFIFGFSSQDGAASSRLSYKVSYEIVEVGSNLIGVELEEPEVESLANRFNIPVRKIAHMSEYFLLAVAVAFPFYVYGLRGFLLLFAAGLWCAAFACGDEYHQSFVNGREPSCKDVLIDSFGIFWGIVAVRIIGWTKRKPAEHMQNPGSYAYRSPDYNRNPYAQVFDPDFSAQTYRRHPAQRASNNTQEPVRTSDQLTEDMSLKKLMRDLRNEKHTETSSSSKTK